MHVNFHTQKLGSVTFFFFFNHYQNTMRIVFIFSKFLLCAFTNKTIKYTSFSKEWDAWGWIYTVMLYRKMAKFLFAILVPVLYHQNGSSFFLMCLIPTFILLQIWIEKQYQFLFSYIFVVLEHKWNVIHQFFHDILNGPLHKCILSHKNYKTKNAF